MALSRLAKKFRELEPQQNSNLASTKSKKNKKAKESDAVPSATTAPAPAPQAVAAPEPLPAPEPVAPPEPPKPGKRQQEKVKRPRFVYVPTKTERKPLAPKPAVQPPPISKLSARIMTQNLALPPEDDATRTPGLTAFGRM
jgi:hypothetical protein